MVPSSGLRSAWAPPRVAARSASATLMPKCVIARETTSDMFVMPLTPGEWPDPSATATPLSSSERTGGILPTCSAEPGQSTAATPAVARTITSSSQASFSRSADAQPSSAASVAAPVRDCPQACSRGSRPAARPAPSTQRASRSVNLPSSQYTSTLSAPAAAASVHHEPTAST